MIWRGWGWIVPIFLYFPLVIVQMAVESISGDATLNTTQLWPKLLGALIGSTVVALLGYYFNWHRRPKSVRQTELVPSHAFFLVPMEYWSVIWLVLIVYLFVLN